MKKIGFGYTHKKGNLTYISGQVEIIVGQPTKIVMFKNEQKKNEKSPDWNIILSEPAKDKVNTQKVENKEDF